MAVLRFALGALGRALLVVWVTATVVFLSLRAGGRDPLEAILGGPGSQAGPDAVAAAVAEYGLDQPLVLQYLDQLRRVATLDLGTSFSRRVPVADLLRDSLPTTAVLATAALVLAWLLALAVALVAVHARGPVGRIVAAALRGLEVVATVTPHFWLGAMLIAVVAAGLGWLPATSTPGSLPGLVLPTITLAVPLAGFLGQLMRDGLEEAGAAPFATSSRARGASPARVFARHTLRHASLPVVALSGWAFGSLLSGAVVVELLFGRPGLGRLLVDATLVGDVPVVIGAVAAVAVLYVVIVTATDALEKVLDPRTRRAGGRSAPSPAAPEPVALS
ncbi:ABC transporter permease [Serinibacter arcticus]|uniref:ABC transporter permease n=1 Tax=Serinibacter arcticus TaxID=1655435 RepID=A0A2U1ZQU8_9MICO|nr:ABC transporter permease [Serinibacter arcticus]PWD49375.1 ABC transporter permease [Serinibacter arcticus]